MTQHGHPEFYRLLDKLAKLHSSKNRDYAEEEDALSNLHECKGLGVEPWKGVLVRLSDKWSRIKNFARRETLEVEDESFIDTLLDNAVYSLLAVILYQERVEDVKKKGITTQTCGAHEFGDGGSKKSLVPPYDHPISQSSQKESPGPKDT